MKILKNTQTKNKWLSKPILAGGYQNWLTDDGSLTESLQNKYINFSVMPINVRYQKLYSTESQLLGLKTRETVLIRDVCLLGNNKKVVFAHSVLPRQSLQGAWSKLGRLGKKPLGAALFADPKVKRTPLSYKKLSRHHMLYQQATKHLDVPPTYLWARRSMFSLNCAKILVTEVFLPQILAI